MIYGIKVKIKITQTKAQQYRQLLRKTFSSLNNSILTLKVRIIQNNKMKIEGNHQVQ